MLDLIEENTDGTLDTLLVGGTVIDPDSGLHGIRNVGITSGRISYIGRGKPAARTVFDVPGKVVAPGFIDLHSHAQSQLGGRLQSLDGVTTALGLESGVVDIAKRCEHDLEVGRVINFGYSASWGLARLKVMNDDPGPSVDENSLLYFERHQRDSGFHQIATSKQISEIVEILRAQMQSGAIGIGTLLGYCPEAGEIEYYRIATESAIQNLPVFTHIRSMYLDDPDSNIAAALELVSQAAGASAHMHMCHVNSTGGRNVDDILHIMVNARELGNRVTFEYYPYTASSTGVGASFLSSENMPRAGRAPKDIYMLSLRRRVSDNEDLDKLRVEDPGALCICDYLDPDNEHDVAKLLHAMTTPDVAAASDAMPLVQAGNASMKSEEFDWPLEPGVFTHPRSLGCFSKVLRWGWRELGIYSLDEAIARCSIIPARILEDEVPSLRHKGRIQIGADADIVVFDPEQVQDRSTYTELRTSFGYDFVFVLGTIVVRNSEPELDAFPGRPIFS